MKMVQKIYKVDEKELISKCKKQDRSAQKYLFERYKTLLFGIIIRYVNDVPTAEDILMDTFLQVFNKIGSFRSKGSFEGWLKRIAVNQALMHIRKHKKMTYTDESHVLDQPKPASELDQLLEQDLLRAVQKLPDGYRTIFNLYLIEGYKHKEIAEMLEISIHTSKSQLIMARKKLIEILKAQKYPGLGTNL